MSTVALHSLDFARGADVTSYDYLAPTQLLGKFQVLSYGEYEHLWSYVGKVNMISRNLLNATARTPYIVCLAGAGSLNSIKTTVTHLKLLSIVSVPFSFVDMKALIQKIAKSFMIDDQEGAAMSSLSFAITAADAVDSVSTFVNSLLAVTASKTIEALSVIALPLGLGISITGTFSRSIQMAKTFSIYQKIYPSNFAEEKYANKAFFKQELEERLGVSEEQKIIELLSVGSMSQEALESVEKLKEKKKSIILRSIPKDATKDFEKIFSLLDAKGSELLADQEFESALSSIERIQHHLEKKMIIGALGILANLTVISALVLFSIGTAGARPFMLMTLAFVIRLSSLIYQDQKLELTTQELSVNEKLI